jgi:hypothetical protein
MNQEKGLTSYKIKPIPVDFSSDQYSLDLSNTGLPLALPVLQEIDIPQKIEGSTEGQIIFNSSKSQLQSYTKQLNWQPLNIVQDDHQNLERYLTLYNGTRSIRSLETLFHRNLHHLGNIPVANDNWYVYNEGTLGTNPYQYFGTLNGDTTEQTYLFNVNQLLTGNATSNFYTYFFEYRIDHTKFDKQTTFTIHPFDLLKDFKILEAPLNLYFTDFQYNNNSWFYLDEQLYLEDAISRTTEYIEKVIHNYNHNGYLMRIRLPDTSLLLDTECLKYTFILDLPDAGGHYGEIEFIPTNNTTIGPISTGLIKKPISTASTSAVRYQTIVEDTGLIIRTRRAYQLQNDIYEFTLTKQKVFVNIAIQDPSGCHYDNVGDVLEIHNPINH